MVCSATEDLVARVKDITGGKGAVAVIDSVGGELSQSLGAAVRDGGSVWLYGLMEGLTCTASGVDCLFRCVQESGCGYGCSLACLHERSSQKVLGRRQVVPDVTCPTTSPLRVVCCVVHTTGTCPTEAFGSTHGCLASLRLSARLSSRRRST